MATADGVRVCSSKWQSAPVDMREWRNGSRARLRPVCPEGREGSTPSLRTLEDKPGRDRGLVANQHAAPAVGIVPSVFRQGG